VLVSPFMPATSGKMLERLGIVKRTAELRLAEDARWGTLEEGALVSKGEALFPRVETAGKKGEKPPKAIGKAAGGPKQQPGEMKKPEAAAGHVAQTSQPAGVPGAVD